MAKVGISGSRIAKALQESPAKIQELLHAGLAKTGAYLEGEIKKAYRANGLKRRTGRLINSIGFAFKSRLSLLVGVVANPGGEPVNYAAQREFGGTITGRPWLAIPLPPVLTGAGVARGSARDYRDHPGQFGFKGTFVHKGVIFGYQASGSGKGITGGRSKVVPLFVLKRSVNQKGAHFVIPTVQKGLPIAAQMFLAPSLRAAITGATPPGGA